MRTIMDPNFSIVVPGPCNGNCSFCFWKPEEMATKYIGWLAQVLDRLPFQFDKISLTGGEPTLSKHLTDILAMISTRRKRWKKVVLTTNGANLTEKLINHMEGIVDHVNISRHDIVDDVNYRLFGHASMPRSVTLIHTIERFNRIGIDVTANCVIHPNTRPSEYIRWAKRVGFSAVCFRKPHKKGCDLKPTSQEEIYEQRKPISESSCPVCRSKTQLIHGINVIWTASIPEPSEGLDLIYEAILHPDGTLSADWSKNIELELPSHREIVVASLLHYAEKLPF